MKTVNAHIRSYDGSNPEEPFGFSCTHCGIREALPSPIPVDGWLLLAKLFTERHRSCAPPGPGKPELIEVRPS